MTWQEFENLCIKYLQQKYTPLYSAIFSAFGGSDSTKADIQAVAKNGQSFFIESKMPVAQSGQFVVLSNRDGFYFSSKNADHDNKFSQQIVDYMNSNEDLYKNPGTSGVELHLPQDLKSDWIKTHYKNKKVKFVISSKDYINFVILPVDKLGEYFEISSKYRVKKSGSGNLSGSNLADVISLTKVDPTSIHRDGKKYFIKSSALVDKQQLTGASCSYQFNETDSKDVFEIRQLSNTNNPNVIFSLVLKSDQKKADVQEFESSLGSLL